MDLRFDILNTNTPHFWRVVNALSPWKDGRKGRDVTQEMRDDIALAFAGWCKAKFGMTWNEVYDRERADFITYCINVYEHIQEKAMHKYVASQHSKTNA